MIYILLVTYDGEKYFFEQMESLLSQNYKNWKIWIHDDGSKDNTVKIIKDYASKYPEKIVFFDDDISCGGAKENFTYVLNNIDKNFDYIMFCDQDDVWKSDKIEKTLEKMQELENLYGNKIPLLVHTDLEVVNEKLEILSFSMWESEYINPRANTLNKLLMQNTITGCTMMINRNLAMKSLSISSKAIMHDWWIGLVATTFGKIGFIEESTIKYRQHGKNDTGTKTYDYKLIINKLKKISNINIDKNIFQSEDFLKEYKEELDEKSKIMLEDFSSIKENPYLQRVNIILKYKLFKYGIIRNIGLLLKI